MREHLGRLVDGDNGMAEANELVRDPADAAAEVEHCGAFGNRRVDALGLARRRKQKVEVDRTAVGRESHVSSEPSCVAFM